MGHALTLHELTGSPNSVKVRIALGYKNLEYERVPFPLEGYPGDRTPVVAMSRQPRLPVLIHGETRMFDSSAILRYLEANFPDSPRLFRDDHEEHGQIEQWEMFSRTQLGEPIGMMFGLALSGTSDAGTIAKANAMLAERAGALEEALQGRDVLVGDHLTAADVTCGAALYLTDLPDAFASSSPIAGFFKENLSLPDSRARTKAWVRRVLAYDAVAGRRG